MRMSHAVFLCSTHTEGEDSTRHAQHHPGWSAPVWSTMWEKTVAAQGKCMRACVRMCVCVFCCCHCYGPRALDSSAFDCGFTPTTLYELLSPQPQRRAAPLLPEAPLYLSEQPLASLRLQVAFWKRSALGVTRGTWEILSFITCKFSYTFYWFHSIQELNNQSTISLFIYIIFIKQFCLKLVLSL